MGLAPGSYAVFYFWNQKYLGVHKDSIYVDVSPHDTRVLLLHPVLYHPQLMGTSRHITGSYSIESQSWDEPAKRLYGVSSTIANTPYRLWARIPKGFRVTGVKVRSHGHDAVANFTLDGELLTIEFESPTDLSDWEISFAS